MMTKSGPVSSLFRRLFGLRPPTEPLPDPVVRLTNLILEEAVNARAQRLHISVQGPQVGTVRYYVDGDWHQVMKMPGINSARVINRLRVMGNTPMTGHAGERATVRLVLEDRVMQFPVLFMIGADDTADVFLDCPS